MSRKNIYKILGVVGLLLLIPLITMQFTKQVNWTLSDFLMAGFMLFAAGILLDFASRKLKTSRYKASIIIIIVLVFLLVWAELAVGIFGTPLAGS